MGDNEKYNDAFIGEDDTDDALTEFAGLKTEKDLAEEEENTPIKERPKFKLPARDEPSLADSEKEVKSGTFIATLRERFAAFFIDSLILFYLYWVYAVAYGRFFLGRWNAETPTTGWHGMALHGSFLLLCFLYYFVLEGIFLATVGKFLCWMTVRKKNGEPASLIATLIRNILRPLDYVLIIPVIFIMEKTKYRQRLGDVLGGSTVVKKFGKVRSSYAISANIASASGRTIAFIIDLALFLLFVTGYILTFRPQMPVISHALLLLSPLALIAYFVLIEMLTESSPGKWLFGYRICQENGRRLTISGSLIRTLWRVFDTNPIGLLSIFISARKQRPGDLAAGTVVIQQKRSAKGALSILIALLLAAGTLYPGMTNQTNIFSSKFKFNFLPKHSLIKGLGFKLPNPGDIAIQNFRFAANERYNYRVPSTFSGGETVFLVFELSGYKKEGRKVWLQEDLAVTYPDGTVGLKQTNIVDYQQVVSGDAPIEFTNNISLPEKAEGGIYKVDITIRDKFAGSEVREMKTFFVRRTIFPTIEPEPE